MSRTLNTYLHRINYTGSIEPTVDVLRAIHRAHLLSIPYENLDIHLDGALSLDLDAIYDKLVMRKRGGWCYEMNGLLAWALREIGFDVTLLGGTVGRDHMGDLAQDNHLVLLVQLVQLAQPSQRWIADVGFGNGILEPLLLVEGEYAQEGFVFRLEPIPPRSGREGSRWLFHNHQHGGVGFDFTLQPRGMGDFAERCTWLQTAPKSGFVRVTVCHRWREDGIHSLRGAVLRHTQPSGVTERVIESEVDYHHALRDVFDLNLSAADINLLWPKVWASHVAWMASQQPSLS